MIVPVPTTHAPLSLVLYRALTGAGGPLFSALLGARLKRGKEEAGRLEERRGHSPCPRPPGALIWCHAASVGEAQAVLPLIRQLCERSAGTHCLLTTGTVTSATLMATRLPPRARHQYVPVDHPAYVRRFLDHWRPDLALWVESELWPNLILETARRHIPMALVNARLSEKTFRAWRRWPRTIAALLSRFHLCLAQDEETAKRLTRLGAATIMTTGNLKYAADPLPVDEKAYSAFRREVAERPLWLAASLHPGEDAIIADVHRRLEADWPDVLSIVVPRHPERGADMAATFQAHGLTTARRTAGEKITAKTAVYIADTLGELGLFYRAAPAAFIGGSLVPHGGQNPLEPARLGCASLHGPHVHNFSSIYAGLDASGGSIAVTDAPALAQAVAALLRDPHRRARQAAAAYRAVERADAVLDRTLEALAPLLPPAETPHARA